ncbi:MAG: 3-isopropylmalate dehydratase small subunit [Candidatus Omnitrophica bacterium CG11_big_fil_rev_8_21_14_0_20_42_13]|uniref:3-isopropylmalate dehydratase small subunit n=1 Tax=Candidatus Ghiorseimicrobium undicola TaxID=1974746 RepID=A0A2H0LY13_9BACT|nr:MAG: 3-isopropylmalate dehydratase small subunit [Candidatus Omnitrophica bacterium CG11_big_fil_rev_8_21_14_0_20_42_13]
MIIKGKVHKFGDDINTDEIIPAKFLVSTDPKELGKNCMDGIEPGFSKNISVGDIIAAGKNFGCGSSREHAPISIKGAQISCVIAKSFARIFYRNSINIGLPILECEKADEFNNGDELEIDLEKGEIKNITQDKVYKTEKYARFMQELINAGGLINWVKQNLPTGV